MVTENGGRKLYSKLKLMLILSAAMLAPLMKPGKSAARQADLLRPGGANTVQRIFLDILAGDGMENINPVVTYNSQQKEFLVVWSTKESDSTWTLWGRRIQNNGVMDAPFPIQRILNRMFDLPVLVYNPDRNEYLLVFTLQEQFGPADYYNINGTFISADGSQISDSFEISSTSVDAEAIASAAYSPAQEIYLVVYDQGEQAEKRILGRVVPADFIPGAANELPSPAFEIAAGTNEARAEPDVTYQPATGSFMVVYTLNSALLRGVRGKLLPEELDPARFSEEIRIANTLGSDISPSIAAGVGEYLVAYKAQLALAQSVINGRRLSLSGAPQGPQNGFLISDNQGELIRRNPDVTTLPGYGYMIAMDNLAPGTGDSGDIFAQSVPTGFDQADDVITVDDSPFLQANPSVACQDGEHCLVVYEYYSSPLPASDSDIRGSLPGENMVYMPVISNGE
jgi:hypothetical protein